MWSNGGQGKRAFQQRKERWTESDVQRSGQIRNEHLFVRCSDMGTVYDQGERGFRGEVWAETDCSQLRGKGGEEIAENDNSYFKNLGCDREVGQKESVSRKGREELEGVVFAFCFFMCVFFFLRWDRLEVS